MTASSISYGALIRSLLMANEEISSVVTGVYPVVRSEASLPYIAYERSGFSQDGIKVRETGNDSITLILNIYSADYTEGVEIAEAAREVLDHASYTEDEDTGLVLTRSTLIDASEGYAADAFVQQLTFTIGISYGNT